MRHRIGPTACQGLVHFETSLRSSDKNEINRERERSWSNIPIKDKHGNKSFKHF